MTELFVLDAALVLYLVATLLALFPGRGRRSSPAAALVLLALALLVHSVAIGLRWQRLGHGPYVNMHEILLSNVWSLHLAVLLAAGFVPALRAVLAALLLPVQLLTVWLLVTPAVDAPAPVTYATIWLPVHVVTGKLFLGFLLLAVGTGLAILWRRWQPSAFTTAPADAVLDDLSRRLLLLAFAFESAMLVAGALWAQDAWGRYWAWDPLETWAFATWLTLAAVLHLRAARPPAPPVSACLTFAVYALAFLTFFGVPFVSVAPHKGAI